MLGFTKCLIVPAFLSLLISFIGYLGCFAGSVGVRSLIELFFSMIFGGILLKSVYFSASLFCGSALDSVHAPLW